jgi:putative redox protein
MTTTLPRGSLTHVDVNYLDGESYEIGMRNHRVLVDQSERDGGADEAPTPTELFVGSLAACVAFYAGRYITRHGYGREGLHVHADFAMSANRPARVTGIRISVRPPADFPADRVPALLAVASHCSVHNSITSEPDITITIE